MTGVLRDPQAATIDTVAVPREAENDPATGDGGEGGAIEPARGARGPAGKSGRASEGDQATSPSPQGGHGIGPPGTGSGTRRHHLVEGSPPSGQGPVQIDQPR